MALEQEEVKLPPKVESILPKPSPYVFEDSETQEHYVLVKFDRNEWVPVYNLNEES